MWPVNHEILLRPDTNIPFASAIHNPNTSAEARAEAEKKLHGLESGSEGKDSAHASHVAGGLKA